MRNVRSDMAEYHCLLGGQKRRKDVVSDRLNRLADRFFGVYVEF